MSDKESQEPRYYVRQFTAEVGLPAKSALHLYTDCKNGVDLPQARRFLQDELARICSNPNLHVEDVSWGQNELTIGYWYAEEDNRIYKRSVSYAILKVVGSVEFVDITHTCT